MMLFGIISHGWSWQGQQAHYTDQQPGRYAGRGTLKYQKLCILLALEARIPNQVVRAGQTASFDPQVCVQY
ncbi:MAG: hypothetical protein JWN13_912 [Betaproteobacteria bacterium]|jgi:hypothetical protein|nr:hypothetical protein [Betaproteobacteria bacterium]